MPPRLPPVIGWAAVTGDVGIAALILFALVFYWTPPHFWALSLRIRKDYAAAGVPMLPVVRGIRETTRQIALYSLLMVAISLLLWPVARMGLVYLGAAVGLGAVFIWQALALWRRGASEEASTQGAIRLYKYSISYLSLLFVAIAIDALVLIRGARTLVRRLSSVTAARRPLLVARRPPDRGACHHAGDGHHLPRRRDDRHRFDIPAHDRPGEGADRLRDVPGQPEQIDPQPGAVRLRPDRARRGPLTHAHLDHCGRLPLLVRDGYVGTIQATAGTCELASLVLLDSGHLHEEFAKREARWEKRHPDLVDADDREEAEAYQTAVDLAAAGGSEEGAVETEDAPTAAVASATSIAEAMTVDPSQAADTGEQVETTVEPEPPVDWSTHDPEAELRRQPPHLLIDLDEPLYTVKDAEKAIEHFRPIEYDEEREVAPGVWATFLDAGHILGSAIIRLRVEDGGEERVIVCSGDLGHRARRSSGIQEPT